MRVTVIKPSGAAIKMVVPIRSISVGGLDPDRELILIPKDPDRKIERVEDGEWAKVQIEREWLG